MTRHSQLGVSDSLLKRYPEFRVFDSQKAVRDFSKTNGRKYGRQVGFRIGLRCAAPATLLSVTVYYLIWDHGHPWWLATLAVVTLAMTISVCLERLFMRRWSRRLLRRLLCEYGLPVCLDCGYDLRGLSEGRCPECGASQSADAAADDSG